MRIAAISTAGLLALTGFAGAAEPTPAPGAPPFPPTLSAVQRTDAAGRKEVLAYTPDQLQRQRGNGGRPPRGRVCFTQAETRDKIIAHRLADPVQALRLGRSEGEALSAKLCRWKPDEFVYEVHVLRSDGRVLKVFMNAESGEAVHGLSASDRDKDRK